MKKSETSFRALCFEIFPSHTRTHHIGTHISCALYSTVETVHILRQTPCHNCKGLHTMLEAQGDQTKTCLCPWKSLGNKCSHYMYIQDRTYFPNPYITKNKHKLTDN